MKYKVGDKVKFLNQVGGGVISKIVSNALVHVKTEDGFEMPTLISEILALDISTGSAQMFTPTYNIELSEEEMLQASNAEHQSSISRIQFSKQKNEAEGIYLSFVPHNQNIPMNGMFNLFLVNHTEMDVLYNFTLKQKDKFSAIDYGSIPAQSKSLITSFLPQDLEKWISGNIQILFHSVRGNDFLDPANIHYKIKSGRFIKDDNYSFSSLIDGKGIHYTLCEVMQIKALQISDYEKEMPLGEVKAKRTIKNDLILKHIKSENTAEIDLHIWELTEDHSFLKPTEVLNFQLDYFNKCLNSAFENHVKKLIIIHGVGAGILKSEIRKELTELQLEFYDAPISVYGVGATIAIIQSRDNLNII